MAIETAAIRRRNAERARVRERRREELLDAADTVIKRAGPGVSMDEIAAEAGITKPVLYRHFGDKDGLYEALTERYVDELARALRPSVETDDPRSRLAATIDAYLSYVERQPERYRFLLHAGEQPRTAPLVAGFRRRHIAHCTIAADESVRRAGLDPTFGEIWAQCVIGMVRAAGASWLEKRSLPRDRLVEYLTAVLWDGFAALRRAAANR
ncbi:MAG TPA: TetR/AcrR family transcriptional regulator [Gaiellaceae bacterium]|nr:TetR/AcrR family transcriptional regulator [Gaiellaceae bacterium]